MKDIVTSINLNARGVIAAQGKREVFVLDRHMGKWFVMRVSLRKNNDFEKNLS